MNELVKSRPVLIGLIAGAILLLAGLAGAAETAKLAPLRLAYSAITVNQAIPWIALETGHFRKHGRDGELEKEGILKNLYKH